MAANVENRDIFCYEWRGENVYADPAVVYRGLTKWLGVDFNAVIAETQSEEYALAETAFAKLRRAVCMVFNLGEPFDATTGQGVLEPQWIAVLDQWTEWLEKKNQTPVSTLTLPPSMAQQLWDSLTTPSSDCGCTSTDTLPGSPTRSSEETPPRTETVTLVEGGRTRSR